MRQDTEGMFNYSIVVVDNDAEASAHSVVAEIAERSPVATTYCVEPLQSIALARNRAIGNSSGDFVAFIDDDELAPASWLLALYRTCVRFGTDGALGPVKPRFDVEPPGWIIRGGFYERATFPTGHVIRWQEGRTGNTLLRSNLLQDLSQPFDPAFVTGEDQDFFRRMIERGCRFVWCNEALVDEIIPPSRFQRTFMMRRAFLGGKIATAHPGVGWADTVRSLATVAYCSCVLPLSLPAGHHHFMKNLLRVCYHGGKLLTLVGLNWSEDKDTS